MEERVIELEIRVAYQDKLISDLDGVVRGFADRVDALEREIAQLKDSVSQPAVGPQDEKPPHY